MVVAARALSNYGGIFDPDPYPAYESSTADAAGVLCNTRDAFIRETRKQCRRGVDLIKIADSTWGDVQTVAEDEIKAVVDEAHRHNVKVAIHSRGSTSTRALRGRQPSTDHLRATAQRLPQRDAGPARRKHRPDRSFSGFSGL